MSDHRALQQLIIDVCVSAGAGRMHNRERWIDSEATLRSEMFADVTTPDGGAKSTLLGGWVRRTAHAPAEVADEEYGGEERTGNRHTYEITLLRDSIDSEDTANALQDTYDAIADAFEGFAVRAQFYQLGYAISPLAAQAFVDAIYSSRGVHRCVCHLTCTETGI